MNDEIEIKQPTNEVPKFHIPVEALEAFPEPPEPAPDTTGTDGAESAAGGDPDIESIIADYGDVTLRELIEVSGKTNVTFWMNPYDVDSTLLLACHSIMQTRLYREAVRGNDAGIPTPFDEGADPTPIDDKVDTGEGLPFTLAEHVLRKYGEFLAGNTTKGATVYRSEYSPRFLMNALEKEVRQDERRFLVDELRDQSMADTVAVHLRNAHDYQGNRKQWQNLSEEIISDLADELLHFAGENDNYYMRMRERNLLIGVLNSGEAVKMVRDRWDELVAALTRLIDGDSKP